RAVCRELRAEIGTLVSGQPKRVRRDGAIRASDHFKFKVSDKALNGNGWMFLEISGAVSANLFTAEQREYDRAFRFRTLRKCLRQFQNCSNAGSIIVRAVENIIAWHIGSHA